MGSATDGWAVGQFLDKNAPAHPLAEHWNGSAWTLANAPTPRNRQGELSGVDELSASDAAGQTIAGLSGGLLFAVGARDITGECCLRSLALTSTSG